jgi:hypothetical protein
MPRGTPEGFQWLDAEPPPPDPFATRVGAGGYSNYPAEDTPVYPTYRDYPSLEQTGGLPYKVNIPLLGYAEHTPKVMLGRTVADVPGLVEPGTIDLTNPYMPTNDAFHIEDGGMHVVLPKWGSREAMIDQYKETGMSFGLFKDEKSANDYIEGLKKYQDLSGPHPPWDNRRKPVGATDYSEDRQEGSATCRGPTRSSSGGNGVGETSGSRIPEIPQGQGPPGGDA